jgi:hypothetical protein
LASRNTTPVLPSTTSTGTGRYRSPFELHSDGWRGITTIGA